MVPSWIGVLLPAACPGGSGNDLLADCLSFAVSALHNRARGLFSVHLVGAGGQHAGWRIGALMAMAGSGTGSTRETGLTAGPQHSPATADGRSGTPARPKAVPARELFLAVFVALGSFSMFGWLTCRGSGGGLVDIDDVPPRATPYCVQFSEASWQDLAQIPGIGPTLARRMIDARDHGLQVDALDDLNAVPGIGPHKLSEISNYLQFPPSPTSTTNPGFPADRE
jgi:competence protein ComEA